MTAPNIFDLIAERAEARQMTLGGQAPSYTLAQQVDYLGVLAGKLKRAVAGRIQVVDGNCQCGSDEVCGDKRCPRWERYMRTTAAAPVLLCGYQRYDGKHAWCTG